MRVPKNTLKSFEHDSRWMALFWAIAIISITSCTHLIRPPETAIPALTPVLQTRIFVQSDKRRGGDFVEFDVPEAGGAILTVVNGAKFGTSLLNRTKGAEIMLNGDIVVKPKEFGKNTDVLKLKVMLLRGTNRLGVKLLGNPGERLSVGIDVLADAISLEPVPSTLIIGLPEFVPAAITFSTHDDKGTPVRFAAAVRGVTTAPTALELQEFNPADKSWVKVAGGDLFDDGINGDLFAGDLVYARQLNVKGGQEGEKRYRIVFRGKHNTVFSQINTLEITRFPVGPDSRKPKLVKDDKTGEEFAAEQVLVSFFPNVSSERVEEIVKQTTEKVTKKTGSVIGYIPQINLIQVELPAGQGTFEAALVAMVKAAVAEFETYDEEVRYAQPNFSFRFEHAPITPDGEQPGSACSSMGGQYGAISIKANEAWGAWEEWLMVGTPSNAKKIAVVDTGIQPSSDLCWGASDTAPLDERDPVGCDPVNVTGDKGDASANQGGHGTKVAGIIAAKHDNVGISGIAHGIPIISFKVGSSFEGLSVMYKVLAAADTTEVAIINLSSKVGTAHPNWRCALEYAAYETGMTVDTPCAGRSASNGKGKLVVAAAGNEGNFISNSFPSYPCLWLDLPAVLCVAYTNDADGLDPLSNHGTGVDLSAPGDAVCTTNNTGGYSTDTGSSFAVPHVSGAAAVLWSMQPGLSAVEVANRLKVTAHPIGSADCSASSGDLAECLLDLSAAVRVPDRLILVLDKSGSMNWSSHPTDVGCGVYTSPPPGCGPSRWTILNQAISQMLATAEPYVELGDRFGVALFDSTVNVDNRMDFAEFNLADISNFISDRTPGGGTSIGAGITSFETELIADASDYHQTILLFTDGDQNQPPYLVTDGSRVLINPTTFSTAGTGIHEFAPNMVDICPFALRADDVSGMLGSTFLQSVGELRCDSLMNSTVSISPSDPELVGFFMQVLNKSLIGDKLEIAQVTSGQIKRSEHASVSEKFTTSRQDLAFTVLVNWAEPGNNLKRVLLRKDGIDFPVTDGPNRIHTAKGDTYMAITLRQPYCRSDGKCVKSEGEWTLQMWPSFMTASSFTYNCYVNVDNASLASKFRVLQSQPGVGHPLRLTAWLTEAGAPIQGLPVGSVRAVLSRPKASLGEVLSKAKVAPAKRPDADPISEAGLKASAMLADPKLRRCILDAIRPSVKKEIILMESTPGFYEATYGDTKVSGIYSVRFKVKGKSTANGNFTRTFSSARSVEVMVDGKATLSTVKVSTISPCDQPGGCYSITLTPVDIAGNLLGPGKTRLIKVTKFSGQILKPISDELDGRYTVRISYPNTSIENPMIEIQSIQFPVNLGE